MLAALLRRFPDRELAIRRLHRSDPRFRSVCDDYEEAAAALHRWAGTKSDGAEIVDYRRLCTDLETEILSLMSLARARQPSEARE
jgi:hypothetical protein